MQIGQIGNYYGGLEAKHNEDGYFWGVENWDGTEWEKIPESLYNELLKFENASERAQEVREEEELEQLRKLQAKYPEGLP